MESHFGVGCQFCCHHFHMLQQCQVAMLQSMYTINVLFGNGKPMLLGSGLPIFKYHDLFILENYFAVFYASLLCIVAKDAHFVCCCGKM